MLFLASSSRESASTDLVGSHASRARSTRRVPRGAGCLFIAALRTTYSRGEKHRAALSLRRSPTSPRSGVTSRGAERSGGSCSTSRYGQLSASPSSPAILLCAKRQRMIRSGMWADASDAFLFLIEMQREEKSVGFSEPGVRAAKETIPAAF